MDIFHVGQSTAQKYIIFLVQTHVEIEIGRLSGERIAADMLRSATVARAHVARFGNVRVDGQFDRCRFVLAIVIVQLK